MTSKLNIESQEWDTLRGKLQALPQELQTNILEESATEVGVFISDVAKSTYPPMPRRQRVYEYWTAKQKRWWWWVMTNLAKDKGLSLPSKTRQQFQGYKVSYKVVDGVKTIDIQGSYRRTNGLVRSLDYAVKSSTNAVTVEYGTALNYAPYVIGDDDEQSEYHKGNWKQLGVLITEQLDRIQEIFADAVAKRINKYLGMDTGEQ